MPARPVPDTAREANPAAPFAPARVAAYLVLSALALDFLMGWPQRLAS